MLLMLVPLLAVGQAQLNAVDDEVRSSHDVLSYHLQVSIPDAGESITAATTVQYRVAAPGDALVLDFDPVFEIDSVVAGDGSRYPDRVRGARLAVPHWGSIGETLSLTIYYHGAPTDGLFIQENIHGRRTAFADNWPNRARHWFPSEDHPSDKAMASFSIEVPAGWKAVANGALEGVDTLAAGRTRWHWRTDTEIATYTMVIGAGEMTVTPIAGPVPQSLWTFAEDSAFAVDGPFRRVTDVVRVFSGLIGPFPYAKLAHVQSSTRFGGMENSSAIFYSERAYASRRAGEGLVAHETAHQWFGDAVTEYDWHHLWLSEGFATYFAAVYFEMMGEPETFQRMVRSARNGYMNSNSVDRPVIDLEQPNLMRLLNANNYQKGAWVLHMLRAEVGDSAFFQGIRDYYRIYRDSTALSSDLMRVMEARSNISLETFFRQWLTQPGYPILEVRRLESALAGELVLQVDQVQSPEWGVYDVSLVLELAGRETRRERIAVSGRSTRVVLDWEGPLDSIRGDPDATLLAEVRFP